MSIVSRSRRLGRREHRRRALGDDVLRSPHGRRRVHGEDLADDEPVAEHADGGQVLLAVGAEPGWVRMWAATCSGETASSASPRASHQARNCPTARPYAVRVRRLTIRAAKNSRNFPTAAGPAASRRPPLLPHRRAARTARSRSRAPGPSTGRTFCHPCAREPGLSGRRRASISPECAVLHEEEPPHDRKQRNEPAGPQNPWYGFALAMPLPRVFLVFLLLAAAGSYFLTLPAEAADLPFADLVDTVARRHGVDPDLIHAVIAVESGYRASAQSRAGAQGLMQLMPGTQRDFGVSDAFDPRQNVDAGVAYLRRLTDEFGTVLALAAYNAGPGAVRRYNGIPPYDETRDYVRAVLARGRPAPGGQGAPPDVLLRRDGQGDHEAAAGVGRGLQPPAEAAGRPGVSNERQIRVGAAGPPQAAADASPLVLPAAGDRLTVVTPRWTATVPSFQHSPQYRLSSSAARGARLIVPPLDAAIPRRNPTDVHGPACCRPPEKLAAGTMTPSGTSARRQLRNSKSCSCGGGLSGACRSARRLRGSEHEGVGDRLQGRRTRRGHRRPHDPGPPEAAVPLLQRRQRGPHPLRLSRS